MAATETTRTRSLYASANRALFAEMIDAISSLEPPRIVWLYFLGKELDRVRPGPLTAGMIRRAHGRFRVLQRFAELKASAEYRAKSNRQVILRVVAEAGAMFPGVRCSRRSIQTWLGKYNTVGEDGLAGGPAALIDRYGRPPKAGSERD